jgi:hypothetical protein
MKEMASEASPLLLYSQLYRQRLVQSTTSYTASHTASSWLNQLPVLSSINRQLYHHQSTVNATRKSYLIPSLPSVATMKIHLLSSQI